MFLGVPGRTAKAVGKVRKKKNSFFPLFFGDIFLFFEGKILGANRVVPNSPQKYSFLLNNNALINKQQIVGRRKFATRTEALDYGSGRSIPRKKRRERTTPRRGTYAGRARGRIFNSRRGKSRHRLCYLIHRQGEAGEGASVEEEDAEEQGEAAEGPDEGRTPPRRTNRKTTGKATKRMGSTARNRVSFHPRLV